MSAADVIFGKPATTSYSSTAATRPPGYGYAQNFFNSLQNIASSPFPQYGGRLDPGLSPTLQDLIQRAQGYASSTPPSILQGAAGTYGRLLSPHLQNPVSRIFGGTSDFTGRLNPNQRVFGGGTAGSMTFPGSQTNYGQPPMQNMNGGGYQSGPMGPNVMTPTNGGGYQSGGPQPMPWMMPQQPQRGWDNQDGGQSGGQGGGMPPGLLNLLSYLTQGQGQQAQGA